MRLTPDDNIVMFIAPFVSLIMDVDLLLQELVHIGTGAFFCWEGSIEERLGIDESFCQSHKDNHTHCNPDREQVDASPVEARS